MSDIQTSKWIKCSDRMPEGNPYTYTPRVLVCLHHKNFPQKSHVRIAWKMNELKTWFDDHGGITEDDTLEAQGFVITHWQPMPEGPKE